MTTTQQPPLTSPALSGTDPDTGLRREPGPTPAWAGPALLGLLAATATALLYLWNLGASGNANDFYAAAVQAGTKSWKAMFFGSLDAGNAITVDKPAAFLWPMEIAGRIFGFSSWSMLVPQALEGVAAVALLTAAVRRVAGHGAGLLAGAALALTPVATLMFRFNNPDAMLTLLLVGAGYAVVRALEGASTRWLLLAGSMVGLGFITKMGQALLVLPFFAIGYLIAAPTGFVRRLLQTLAAGVAMVVGAGWWVAIVELWPASSRPYIGGSTSNSILDLAFGYNGLGRLFGGSGNGGGGGGGAGGLGGAGNTGFGGATGLTRLFGGDFATEISWLLPTALVALVAGLWLTRRNPRTDLARAGLIIFGGWLVVTGLVFSEMQGTIHPYYTVALAPAIAAVVAITGRELWRTRDSLVSRLTASALVAVTAWWDIHLLGTSSSFLPWLRFVLAVAAAAAIFLILMVHRVRRAVAGVALMATLVGLGGSTAYAVDTASQAHTGSIPSSGPVASQLGGGGTGGPSRGLGGGGSTSTSSAVVTLLKATSTRWAAATIGSQSAAPWQLASSKAVMSIGGFNGGDASPTLAQFQTWVAEGKISYFIGSGTGGGGGPSNGGTGSQISTWVAAHYQAKTVGGTTIYDLTATAS